MFTEITHPVQVYVVERLLELNEKYHVGDWRDVVIYVVGMKEEVLRSLRVIDPPAVETFFLAHLDDIFKSKVPYENMADDMTARTIWNVKKHEIEVGVARKKVDPNWPFRDRYLRQQ